MCVWVLVCVVIILCVVINVIKCVLIRCKLRLLIYF